MEGGKKKRSGLFWEMKGGINERKPTFNKTGRRGQYKRREGGKGATRDLEGGGLRGLGFSEKRPRRWREWGNKEEVKALVGTEEEKWLPWINDKEDVPRLHIHVCTYSQTNPHIMHTIKIKCYTCPTFTWFTVDVVFRWRSFFSLPGLSLPPHLGFSLPSILSNHLSTHIYPSLSLSPLLFMGLRHSGKSCCS